ncbi:E3 ubiquitin-protein ligase TRIM45-like [Saccostrea cucullata]|uniref:E3 ubiquitin-protein ligase TRIM45-like n=1 Tax=Saccostrea cuccullata TaxID=36930 RepID=UPI002ED1ADCD
MATYGASISAQHYIECGNCEENPAQYLCKTCAGYLCETCTIEHKKKKITRNHDIIHLISDKGEGMELLFCPEHTTKKLDCYCCPCQKPVCVKCLMETHNGHKVENLASVYCRVKDELEKEKEEIETTLLPKYKELLSTENAKISQISQRTNEVERQICNHTVKVISQISAIKDHRVQDLRNREQGVLMLVENAKRNIETKIDTLEKIKTQITNNLGANPGITFFKAINRKTLTDMRNFPKNTEYKLDDFKGNINGISQEKNFGNLPEFSVFKPEDSKDQKHDKRSYKFKPKFDKTDDWLLGKDPVKVKNRRSKEFVDRRNEERRYWFPNEEKEKKHGFNYGGWSKDHGSDEDNGTFYHDDY